MSFQCIGPCAPTPNLQFLLFPVKHLVYAYRFAAFGNLNCFDTLLLNPKIASDFCSVLLLKDMIISL